jgi:HK97 family phage portal protein
MKLQDDRPSEYWDTLRSTAVQNATGSNGARYLDSSNAKLLDWLGVPPSSSGVMVTPETAMRVAAVYACVSRIAGGISSLPLNIYERTWDADRREYQKRQVENAPLWWLLNEQPTASYSGAAHWESRVAYMLLRGDGFTLIRRNAAGQPVELVPFPWEAIEPMRLNPLEIGSRLIYSVNDGLSIKGVDQDDMLHFPGFGFNGIRSRSVISHAARNAAGNALAMDEYSGAFFQGGAHSSVVLETDKKMNDDQIEQLQRQFRTRYSGLQNAHRFPMVLTEGMKAESISINAVDAQLLDARRFQVTDIARAFGVPPHLIGETSGSTSWGSGIDSMGRAFVQYTLEHHLGRIEQELNRKLFRTVRYFVEFDRSSLMEGDLVAQSKFYRAAMGGPGIGKGWMSANEVRKRHNLPPEDGQDTIFDPTPPAKASNPPKQGANA